MTDQNSQNPAPPASQDPSQQAGGQPSPYSQNIDPGAGSTGYYFYYTGSMPTQWITIPIDMNASATQAPVEKKKTKRKEEDGCICKKCKEFYPYAEPNQEDGTLICYGCRKHW
jgi:hypothetical protein